jgi:hypothetical protein
MVEFIVTIILAFGCPSQNQINFYCDQFNGRRIDRALLTQLVHIEEVNPIKLHGYFNASDSILPISINELFNDSIENVTTRIIGKCQLFNNKGITSVFLMKKTYVGWDVFRKEIYCLNIKNEIVYSAVLIFCEDEISETFVVANFDM